MTKTEVTHEIPSSTELFFLKDMPVGSIGVTQDGIYYYATKYSVICLSDVDQSYHGNKGRIPNYLTGRVRLLPPGTKVTVTVSQYSSCHSLEQIGYD